MKRALHVIDQDGLPHQQDDAASRQWQLANMYERASVSSSRSNHNNQVNQSRQGKQFSTAANSCCIFPFGGQKRQADSSGRMSVAVAPRQGMDHDHDAGSTSASSSAAAAAAATTIEMQLAQEINQLSGDERESIYDDIHGVSKMPVEDEQFIESRLKKLDVQLRKMKAQDRVAYDKAAFLNPKYVRSKQFLLMFLRSEVFHPLKTAVRLTQHFQEKLRLFGPDLLSRHIYYSDLRQGDKDSLRSTSGAFIFSTCKDKIGRAILYQMYAEAIEEPTSIRHSRAFWYIIMACLEEDEDTQRKGITSINYAHGATRRDFSALFESQKSNQWVLTAVPMRIAASHFCVDDNRLAGLLSLVLRFLPAELRTRTRLHYGSRLECEYAINTFGVFSHLLPVDYNGRAREDLIIYWIDDLAKREEEQREQETRDIIGDRTDLVLHPREIDVLVGRGRPFQNHPGTIRMMQLVESKRDDHNAKRRSIKKSISEDIVRSIHESGGKFLHRDEATQYWSLVPDGKAHQKVAMGFRNLSRQASTMSSTDKAAIAEEEKEEQA